MLQSPRGEGAYKNRDFHPDRSGLKTCEICLLDNIICMETKKAN